MIRVAPNEQDITKPKSVKYYTEKEGFASLKNILPFRYQDKIIFGTEKGLYIHNPVTDRFEPFCELGKQFCDGSRDVFGLKEMPDGKVWISPLENKNADIGYLQPNPQGGYDWVYQPFRRIPEMLLVAFYIEPNGVAWIGGSEGLYRYDMTKDAKDYQQSFHCLVREVRTTGDSVIYYGGSDAKDFINTQEFDYQYHNLKFEFAAPFFDQEEKTLYSFRLEGFEDNWSAWGRQTEKEYTNLSEGTYTFSVKARNVYGVESETASYTITILPPWQRTIGAYLLYSVLAILFVWLLVRWNTRRLEAEKIALEGIVIQRTKEVVMQKEEIQQQAEEIGAQRDAIQESYENVRLMSDIGKEITQHILIENLIDTVYREVNKLMPADGFGIGIFNERENRIDFPGYIEKGGKLPFHYDELGDNDSLSDICFNQQRELVINDLDAEIAQYLPKRKIIAGESPESLIYLPLLVKGKALGNITVQSFKKNAYTKNHLNLFRNIAVYASIAIDNAQLYDRTESLLLNILPKETANELKEKGFAEPKHFDAASVLFTDFKGFTQISEKLTPQEIIAELDTCFQAFDEICKKYNLEKIKTIGDAYMAVSGVPVPNAAHAQNAVKAGLDMLKFMERWKADNMAQNKPVWEVRIGIHSGPLVAGVVGKHKFAYDIWGDTVNTASRMESSGEAGKLNISDATHQLIATSTTQWAFEYRGELEAKGKGKVGMWFVA